MLITVTLPNLMISNLNSNTSQLLQHFYQGKKNSYHYYMLLFCKIQLCPLEVKIIHT